MVADMRDSLCGDCINLLIDDDINRDGDFIVHTRKCALASGLNQSRFSRTPDGSQGWRLSKSSTSRQRPASRTAWTRRRTRLSSCSTWGGGPSTSQVRSLTCFFTVLNDWRCNRHLTGWSCDAQALVWSQQPQAYEHDKTPREVSSCK